MWLFKRDGDHNGFASDKDEKFSIVKNVVLISFGFTFLFTAYNSSAALQSSVNKDKGLGTDSLMAIYVALIFSCMFLPSGIIKLLTAKWTICVCMICYSTYIAAQFYARYYTLIPTAIILGLAAAPMWSAKCKYLTQVGTRYALLSGENSEHVIVRYFGIFFLLFQTSSVWGHVISSTVLQNDNATEVLDINYGQCGANYCPQNEVESSNSSTSDANFEIDDSKRYLLFSIYLVLAILGALLIALTVDPLKRFEIADSDKQEELTGIQLLIATFRHLRNPYQVLLIPLTIWAGLEQGFFSADFTAGFVSCSWGVANVGYVLICYGVCDAICSFGFGPIMKVIGTRVPVFIFGAIINFGLIIAMFQWEPNPNQKYVFFLMAGFWGVADAIWLTQINALYGVVFPNQAAAAFSNYRLWESLGFVIAYIYGNRICLDAKLGVITVCLILGMIGYLIVEWMIWKKKRNSALETPDSDLDSENTNNNKCEKIIMKEILENGK